MKHPTPNIPHPTSNGWKTPGMEQLGVGCWMPARDLSELDVGCSAFAALRRGKRFTIGAPASGTARCKNRITPCRRPALQYIIGLFTALLWSVSYTHLRAHETRHDLVCRL